MFVRSVDAFVHCLHALGDTVLYLYKHPTLLSVELPKDMYSDLVVYEEFHSKPCICI